MAYSLSYDFAGYLAADDETLPPDDEFMPSLEPHLTDDTNQMPQKYIFQHSTIESSGKVNESEITKMLRITPGVLPPVDRFPKSYQPPKPLKLPAFIPADERNKIPILLDEKYFKFQHNVNDDDEKKSDNKSVFGMLNDLDRGGSCDKGIVHRHNRNIYTCAKGIDSCGSNRTHPSIEILEKYFHAVFCDTDDSSEENNCNVGQLC